MIRDINPLKAYKEFKLKKVNEGMEKYGVKYLIKINGEVNNVYKGKCIQTEDYKKVRKEQEDGGSSKV